MCVGKHCRRHVGCLSLLANLEEVKRGAAIHTAVVDAGLLG